jgi:CrcB protein
MLNLIAVFIGGGFGSVLRFLTGEFMLKNLHLNLPLATFLVNIAGGVLIGFLFAVFVDKPQINPALKFALTAGFCGGLTTFSMFSLELFEMVKNAQFVHAIAYAFLSVIICFAAVSTGVYCAKFV